MPPDSSKLCIINCQKVSLFIPLSHSFFHSSSFSWPSLQLFIRSYRFLTGFLCSSSPHSSHTNLHQRPVIFLKHFYSVKTVQQFYMLISFLSCLIWQICFTWYQNQSEIKMLLLNLFPRILVLVLSCLGQVFGCVKLSWKMFVCFVQWSQRMGQCVSRAAWFWRATSCSAENWNLETLRSWGWIEILVGHTMSVKLCITWVYM